MEASWDPYLFIFFFIRILAVWKLVHSFHEMCLTVLFSLGLCSSILLTKLVSPFYTYRLLFLQLKVKTGHIIDTQIPMKVTRCLPDSLCILTRPWPNKLTLILQTFSKTGNCCKVPLGFIWLLLVASCWLHLMTSCASLCFCA